MRQQLRSGTVNRKPTAVTVWIRWNWLFPWQHMPELEAMSASSGAMPAGSSATLRYNYGYMLYPDLGGVAKIYTPNDLTGAFVKISMHNEHGSNDLFFGIITGLRDDIGGTSGGIERGQILYDCRGLEYLLRQYDVNGSYCVDEFHGLRYVHRSIPMNISAGGYGITGGYTRSTTPDDDGIYVFGDGAKWSNLDFIYYVLKYYQQDGMNWTISGPGAWLLTDLQAELTYDGRSVLDIANKLIDSNRGIGWCVRVIFNQPIIWVYSEIADFFNFNMVVSDNNDPMLEVDYAKSIDTFFDDVSVVGNNVKTTATYQLKMSALNPPDSTSNVSQWLVPAWSITLENEYKSLTTDDARMEPKYKSVFQHWCISPIINYEHIEPLTTPDGSVWISGFPTDSSGNYTWGKPYQWGQVFDRTLPVKKDYQWLADMFNYLDNPAPILIYRYLPDDFKYETIDNWPVSFEVSPDSGRLGITFDSKNVPHLMAKNQLSVTSTAFLPEIDPVNVKITATHSTDSRPFFTYSFSGRYGPLRKSLIINVPADFWYIAKNATLSIHDGLEHKYTGNPIIKDERLYMLRVIQLAVAIFGKPRRPMQFSYKYIAQQPLTGALVVGCRNNKRFRISNSTITNTQWDFANRTTTISTSAAEMNVNALVENLR